MRFSRFDVYVKQFPRPFGKRRFGNEFKPLARGGVRERERIGPKRQLALYRRRAAVAHIAVDGRVYRRRLHPYLVRPARVQLYFGKRKPLALFKYIIVERGELCALLRLSADVYHIV